MMRQVFRDDVAASLRHGAGSGRRIFATDDPPWSTLESFREFSFIMTSANQLMVRLFHFMVFLFQISTQAPHA
jgi:hypothetical protein